MNDRLQKRFQCKKVVGNPYDWQNPCPCNEYKKEEDKYRWHDLRKNPADNPKTKELVEAITIVEGRKEYTHLYYKPQWHPYGWNTGWEVIAWRYIEPFDDSE